MKITIVCDAVCEFEIEVPDGSTEEECKAAADRWFDDNFYEVADAINNSEIAIREVEAN